MSTSQPLSFKMFIAFASFMVHIFIERRLAMNPAILKESELAMPTYKESALAAKTGRHIASVINCADKGAGLFWSEGRRAC